MIGDEVQVLEIDVADFDVELLPTNARVRGTLAFKIAVERFLKRNLEGFAGWYDISVEDERIRATWKSSTEKPDAFDEIIEKLRKREHKEGIQLLRMLLPSRDTDPSLHYNLGMVLSDVGQLVEAEKHIRRTLELEPDFTNARVALGVALARKRDWRGAVAELNRAVGEQPDNGYALRNLAACLASLGEYVEGEQFARRAVDALPDDQAAWVGLGQVLFAQEKIDEADEVLQHAIAINEFGDLAEVAKQTRGKIAESSFKRKAVGGIRPDAVMYCLSALQKFAALPPDDVRKIAFEIAAVGMKGINPNDPDRTYTLRTMPENRFTGLQLLSYMYVGFKQVAPEMNVSKAEPRDDKYST
jgi:Flp pilus assembly protein TadD